MSRRKLTFRFSFGLVPGEDGINGVDGLPGQDGLDGADGQNGADGEDGVSCSMKFIRTSDSSNEPYVDLNNANPGAGWTDSMPSYTPPQAIWSTIGFLNGNGSLARPWTRATRITPVDGEDGAIPILRYTKTSGENEVPSFVSNNINPGSEWLLNMPGYTPPEVVWMITSKVNTDGSLYENWGNLFRLTPIDVNQEMITGMVIHAISEEIEWEASAVADDEEAVRADVTLDLEDI